MKKKNILIAIVITVFFLIIAYLTTFRLSLYAFIICYIGVIIAKSKNKRLKVPVPDFFILTFSVGIVFAFMYSISPKLQYYEFRISHSRWEISKIDKLDVTNVLTSSIQKEKPVVAEIHADMIFKNANGFVEKQHKFHYFQTNIFEYFNSNSEMLNEANNEVITSSLEKDFYLFKKPSKEIYKVFNKSSWIKFGNSESNFFFSILFILLFISISIYMILNFKKVLSTLLNQHPKKEFKLFSLLIFFLISYVIIQYYNIL